MRVRGTRSDLTFVTVLLALSLGMNIYLARRAFGPPPSAPEVLARGERVPPLSVIGLDGEKTTRACEGKPTVLYIFTPSCPWCRKNWLGEKASNRMAQRKHGKSSWGVSLLRVRPTKRAVRCAIINPPPIWAVLRRPNPLVWRSEMKPDGAEWAWPKSWSSSAMEPLGFGN